MIVLNEKVLDELNEPEHLIKAIEKAYLIQDDQSTYIPDRPHLSYEGNTLLLMPGFTKEVFGTKLISIFPENLQHNKPFIHGLMVINDSETGEVKAILNGSKLTAIRTAAVAATAFKYMSYPTSRSLGIIGAGVQAFHAALCCMKAFQLERLIISSRTREKAEMLKDRLKALSFDIAIESVATNSQLVAESDVVITTTTSKEPLFNMPFETIKDKVFIAIGSYRPDMMELPLNMYDHAAEIFVDTLFASEECGDLAIPLEKGVISADQIIPFNRLVKNELRPSDSSIRIFKSVGMSLFDLTVSDHLYKQSQKREIGHKIVL